MRNDTDKPLGFGRWVLRPGRSLPNETLGPVACEWYERHGCTDDEAAPEVIAETTLPEVLAETETLEVSEVDSTEDAPEPPPPPRPRRGRRRSGK